MDLIDFFCNVMPIIFEFLEPNLLNLEMMVLPTFGPDLQYGIYDVNILDGL